MKKNTKVLALAGLGVVTLVGGTFAYYSASQTFNNPFDTSNYGTSAVEKFNPGDGNEWVPGATVDKEVIATNTGEGDVWVRVKFDEEWTKADGSALKENGLKWYSGDATFNPATDETGYQADATDGLVAGDTGSVVYKNFQNVTTDKTEANKWYKAGEYYYYTSTLNDTDNKQTVKILDDVTLCEDTDMGSFTQIVKYARIARVEGQETAVPAYPGGADWKDDAFTEEEMKGYDIFTYKANELDDTKPGYANANYELNITVEFVQADPDAAADWTWYPGKTETAAE